MADRPFTYESSVHTVSGRRGGITVENLSPLLRDEERAHRRRRVEEGLFDIFAKYTEHGEQ